MKLAIFALSVTSSWGNGHATTYRALARALDQRGHQVHFFERDVPWYSSQRDLPTSPHWTTTLYQDPGELARWEDVVRQADAVIVGSYVPDGRAVSDWVLRTRNGLSAFYDLDTPVTREALQRGECEYLSVDQVPLFDLYLSFTGGDVLRQLEQQLGARRARPLYCAVDEERYRPVETSVRWDLGYLGTYSADRQQALQMRLIEPATRWPQGRFVIAGPQFPATQSWPANVEHLEHVAPPAHPTFYSQQRFTLNVTRAAMVATGYAPSVRLFEAAACGCAIVSDSWQGLDSFFVPGKEILLAETAERALQLVRDCSDEERSVIGAAARQRVLREHTAAQRALELESYFTEV